MDNWYTKGVFDGNEIMLFLTSYYLLAFAHRLKDVYSQL